MTDEDDTLPTNEQAALLRWRLAIGRGAEATSERFGLQGLAAESEGLGIPGGSLGDVDDVLGFVYDDGKSAAATRPYLPGWLGRLRDLFPSAAVALVQKDAIERKGLTRLLFEPETLPYLERNIELVTTLVSAKGLVPERAKDIAREIVRDVVAGLRSKLETETRTALLGAVRRGSQSPLRVARNLDWKKTIERNLKTWDQQAQRLVAERLYFWSSQRRRHEWDVVLVVDQSGSMAESLVYAAVMAAIFASLDVLRTRLLFFDTDIVDMTPVLTDPVEVLFSAQLGGGTDINRAVAYASEHFVDRPEKTLFLAVTDLFEGGDREQLVARMRALVDSRVKTLVLLALSDKGRPSFDHELAAELEAVGVHCFGATPQLLVSVMERIMKGQDIHTLVAASTSPSKG